MPSSPLCGFHDCVNSVREKKKKKNSYYGGTKAANWGMLVVLSGLCCSPSPPSGVRRLSRSFVPVCRPRWSDTRGLFTGGLWFEIRADWTATGVNEDSCLDVCYTLKPLNPGGEMRSQRHGCVKTCRSCCGDAKSASELLYPVKNRYSLTSFSVTDSAVDLHLR